VGSCGWTLDNEIDIISKGNDGRCYKVIINEKNDEVVDIHSSLMAGITRAVFGRKHLVPGSNFYLTKKDL